MKNEETVLILGAGASKPYGFPTGSELKQMIMGSIPAAFRSVADGALFVAKSGNWKQFVEEHLDRSGDLPPNPVIEDFRRRFEKSEVYSVDRFVFRHQDVDAVARYHISLSLLVCERYSKLRGGWYQALWNDIVIPALDDDLGILDIVTFNYDRSLEQYIEEATKATYPSGKELRGAKVSFHHVYGSLGKLNETSSRIGYGQFDDFENSARHLNLIPPRAATSPELARMLASKKTAIFLGFGFDELNMRVLGINRLNRPERIFATRMGLSTRAKVIAEEKLGPIYWGSPDQDVAEFLHQSEAFA